MRIAEKNIDSENRRKKILGFLHFLAYSESTRALQKNVFVTECIFGSVFECSSIKIIFKKKKKLRFSTGCLFSSVNAQKDVFFFCNPQLNNTIRNILNCFVEQYTYYYHLRTYFFLLRILDFAVFFNGNPQLCCFFYFSGILTC